MVAGIIVTHGNLAEELIRTARTVLGEFSDCHAFTNNGKSTTSLYEEIRTAVDDDAPCIIFVDFLGGSCSHACLRVATDRPNTTVMCGVNLPMLLAFINKRDEVSFAHLSQAVLERAHAAVKVVDPEDM